MPRCDRLSAGLEAKEKNPLQQVVLFKFGQSFRFSRNSGSEIGRENALLGRTLFFHFRRQASRKARSTHRKSTVGERARCGAAAQAVCPRLAQSSADEMSGLREKESSRKREFRGPVLLGVAPGSMKAARRHSGGCKGELGWQTEREWLAVLRFVPKNFSIKIANSRTRSRKPKVRLVHGGKRGVSAEYHLCLMSGSIRFRGRTEAAGWHGGRLKTDWGSRPLANTTLHVTPTARAPPWCWERD
jgi:hypothetical protein